MHANCMPGVLPLLCGIGVKVSDFKHLKLMQLAAYLTHIIGTCVESVCLGLCQHIPEAVGKQLHYDSRIK